jgi:hypothetical protein
LLDDDGGGRAAGSTTRVEPEYGRPITARERNAVVEPGAPERGREDALGSAPDPFGR